MSRILQRPKAVDDLVGIWTYIARHNPGAADRTLDALERVIALAADFPLMGRARPDLLDGLRSFVSGDYLLDWQPIPNGIELFRVVHGARLFSSGDLG